MENTNGIKTWQWVVTVIVIIILVILGYKMFSKPAATTTSTEETQSTDTTATDQIANATNRIMIADQAPGDKVYISSVQFASPGFVIIQKDNKGVPGDVIGSKYFEKGIFPGQVTLTSSTNDGSLYYAVLYSDTDGDKKFDIKKDLPIKDSKGATILKPFRVTSSPTELKG